MRRRLPRAGTRPARLEGYSRRGAKARSPRFRWWDVGRGARLVALLIVREDHGARRPAVGPGKAVDLS